MKKIIALFLAACLTLTMVACGSDSSSSTPTSSSTPASSQSPENEEKTAILYTAFSLGGTDGSEYNVTQHDFKYKGDLTIEKLAEGLTELTGYDFSIEVLSVGEGSAAIEWKKDSALAIAGSGMIEPKEGFMIMEITQINWFLLDSLYTTVSENLGITEIYYQAEGNLDNIVNHPETGSAFTPGMVYLGSNFYKNHSGNVGDDEAVYALTKGKWQLEGDHTKEYFEMDGEGGISLILGDGTPMLGGYLEYVDFDYTVTYSIFRDDNGEYFDEFYFIDDDIIVLASKGTEYIRMVG